jgi:Uma2 family endonuclease
VDNPRRMSDPAESIGGMTMANPIGLPVVGGRPWTLDDLDALPDDGYRYEIFDGSLLVSPQPAVPHFRATTRLHRLLDRQAPDGFYLGQNAGVYPNRTNFYVPDLIVIRAESMEGEGRGFLPGDVLLAVEVVSPTNPGADLVLKRHAYAVAEIREYWIVDERDRTLRVLMPDGEGGYAERAVVKPGDTWRSVEPFPLAIDPAEVFRPA